MPRRRTKDFDLPPRGERRYKSGRISYLPPTGGRISLDLPPNATGGQIWEEYERITQQHNPLSIQSLFDEYERSDLFEQRVPFLQKYEDFALSEI